MAEEENSIRSLVCDTCWNGPFQFSTFQEYFFQGKQREFTDLSWRQIQKSAQNGCNWCRHIEEVAGLDAELIDQLADEFFTEDAHEIDEDEDIDSYFEDYQIGFTISVPQDPPCTPKGRNIMNVIHYEGQQENEQQRYILYTTAGDKASTFVTAREPIIQVSSNRAYDLALAKFSECLQHHPACRATETALPTRVLDISDSQNPKLLVTNGFIKGYYAALSYVWGEKQPSSTNQTNISSYITGISTALLPQTILDAIYVTRRLGLQYLWVDSLCIIQDSPSDKKKEIKQMRRIFEGSLITITAASAQKVSEGFLQTRERPAVPTYQLPFWCPDGTLGTMFMTGYIREADDSIAEAVDSRAWCLEERLLSKRVLLYTSHTMQYQCLQSFVNIGDSMNMSAFYAHSMPTNNIERNILLRIRNDRLPDALYADDILPSPSDRELKLAWNSIIENYTNRSLTAPEDKLRAIAGIASKFRKIWPDSVYLFGLWQHNLLGDLLWYIPYRPSDQARYFPRPADYRAPSWSWASIDGAVDLTNSSPANGSRCLCDILEEYLPQANETSYLGDTSGRATLVLRASLRAVRWDRYSQVDKVVDPVSEAFIGIGYADALEENLGEILLVSLAMEESGYKTILGLLVVSAEQGRFRRVGAFQSRNRLDGGRRGSDTEEIAAQMAIDSYLACDKQIVTIV